MAGEIYKIECECGVHGSIVFGQSDFDIFERIRLGGKVEEKFRYITIDNKLELIELECEKNFAPNSHWIFPKKLLKRFVTDQYTINCPNCHSYWKVVGVINFS